MVITLYENNTLIDNYIISIPSGEIIYCTDDDIISLFEKGYIYHEEYWGKVAINRYVCSPFFFPLVLDYMKEKNIERNPKNQIVQFLLNCGLLMDQFKINIDYSIDAFGPVDMSFMKLNKIPYKFNRCTSDFNCSYNDLKTLENSPNSVHGSFNCSNNKLEDLFNGPRLVSRLYNCSYNSLTSLIGSPIRLKYFDCSHNQLKDLIYGPVVTDNYIKTDNLFS